MKDKSKIVTIVLVVVCVISIIGVVYLYIANSSLKSENANLQSELENNQSQLEELQEKITELQATVETLEEAKASLEAEQAAATATNNTADNTEVTTESTDTDAEGGTATGEESGTDEGGVTVNSTHDDVQLGDDEYKGDNEIDGAYDRLSDEEKAEVDQILEEVKKEHPELFEDNGGNIPYTGPTQGTPSTGVPENPDWQFGQGDYSEGAGAIVY